MKNPQPRCLRCLHGTFGFMGISAPAPLGELLKATDASFLSSYLSITPGSIFHSLTGPEQSWHSLLSATAAFQKAN